MSAEAASVESTTPERPPIWKRQSWWKLISLGVSVALMVYIIVIIDFEHLFEMIRSVPLWAFAGVFVIYSLLSYFRTLRFLVLLGHPRPSIRAMVPIVLFHNFLVRTLPFKTGEISYVVLLRRNLNQPVSEGISSLLTARLFELALVLVGSAFGLLSLSDQTLANRELWFVLLLVGLVAYVVGLYYSGHILRWFARQWVRLVVPRIEGRFPKVATFVEDKLLIFAEQFGRVNNPRLLLTVVGLSTLTFSMSTMFDITLMHGLGLGTDITFGAMVAIICIKMFIESAPIAVSGFGVIETGWAFGLVTLAGLGLQEAAAIGLFLHGMQVFVSGVYGLIGYIVILRTRRSAEATENRTESLPEVEPSTTTSAT